MRECVGGCERVRECVHVRVSACMGACVRACVSGSLSACVFGFCLLALVFSVSCMLKVCIYRLAWPLLLSQVPPLCVRYVIACDSFQGVRVTSCVCVLGIFIASAASSVPLLLCWY
jgi:hypothetical protein